MKVAVYLGCTPCCLHLQSWSRSRRWVELPAACFGLAAVPTPWFTCCCPFPFLFTSFFFKHSISWSISLLSKPSHCELPSYIDCCLLTQGHRSWTGVPSSKAPKPFCIPLWLSISQQGKPEIESTCCALFLFGLNLLSSLSSFSIAFYFCAVKVIYSVISSETGLLICVSH